MTQAAISEAIATLTQHVRKWAHITAWDTVRWPTEEEIAARRAAIESVCDEIDDFANRSKSEDTRFVDFEVLRAKLNKHSAFPLLTHINDVADAFQKAGRLDRV